MNAIDGFVAERMLRAVALPVLVVVMVLNVLWNYAFFD